MGKITPRKCVYNLLLRMESGAYSSAVLDSALKSQAGNFDNRDKAFIAALFYGTLERKLTLDYIMNRFVKSGKPPEIETRVLIRIALYQLIYMDSVPDSAAVNEAVELSHHRAKGYINAVLRNFLRAKQTALTELEQASLSIMYSCPEPLVEKWRNEYGDDVTLRILETSLQKPPDFYVDNDVSGKHERKQDMSSQIACELFNPQAGETIIDLCAAPGGKTFTIAQLMNNNGRVISCDISGKKVEKIKANAQKLGLSIIETLVNDAKAFNPDFPKADRVLCDVPCSGLGVIRRKPEIKYKDLSGFDGLPAVQFQILMTAVHYVKEQGHLMYSTCTLSRAENDDIIEKFLSENADFTLLEKRTNIPARDGGDGFFMALMVKK